MCLTKYFFGEKEWILKTAWPENTVKVLYNVCEGVNVNVHECKNLNLSLYKTHRPNFWPDRLL